MLPIKERLKSIDSFRRIVKKIKIYKGFFHDAVDYSKYYLESAERCGNPKYRIMLLVHSLEKGMCMKDLRPFGQQKAIQLKEILEKNGRKSGMEFEFDLGLSILSTWISFYDNNGWTKNNNVVSIERFLEGKSAVYQAGRREYRIPSLELKNENFTEVMLCRHSIRDFADRNLNIEDIDYAVQMFLEAPTACNRQMCKVYYIKNRTIVDLLNKTVLGVGGFNKDTLNYFIITYDIAAFDIFGERNQGYLNAGLVAMNFANGLHARGIGSCFMQWANKRSEDENMRKALKLGKSERIAVVLAAGYYKEDSYIPCSVRRPTNEVYNSTLSFLTVTNGTVITVSDSIVFQLNRAFLLVTDFAASSVFPDHSPHENRADMYINS